MALDKKLFKKEEAAAAEAAPQEGLILHLDANDDDSYDGDGTVWYDITDHEYVPTVNPEEHFNTVLYTGSGDTTNGQSITGVGFKPDLIWFKSRSTTYEHVLYDSLRGVNSAISTRLNDAAWDNENRFESFDADGFTIEADNSSDYWKIDRSSQTYVAWCFKAGGEPDSGDKVSIDGTSYSDEAAAGLTAGNVAVDGLSVNTKLGFSIIKFDSGTGNDKTVAHGLGQKPELIISKPLVSGGWLNWHKAFADLDETYVPFSSALPTDYGSSLWNYSNWGEDKIGFDNVAYGSNNDVIAYCFTSKRGVSKVGSYTGTGASGNKVYTGFEPAWLMIKNISTTGYGWYILDNKRDTDSVKDNYLDAADRDAEADAGTPFTFDRDGFTITDTNSAWNKSGDTYIYLAFAKNTKETQLTPEKGDFVAEDTVTTGAELEFDANDYSGTGNWLNTGDASSSDGTITGAQYTNDGTSDYFTFDGNDYITSSSSGLTANTYTIEAWFRITNKDTSGIVAWGDADSNNERRSMITWNGGSGSDYYLYSSSYASNVSGNTALEAGRWYHGVVTMDDGEANIYLDGEHDGSGTNSLASYTSTTLYIGRTQQSSGEFFDGQIALARVYDTVLTSAQIKANYDATYGLYQHADLELHLDAGDSSSYSGSGSTWSDLANSNDATITGASYDEELGNFFSFDGTDDEMTLSGSTSLTDRTVEIWYRTNDKNTNYWVFDSTPDSGSTNSFGVWALYIDSTYIYGIGSKFSSNTYGAALCSSSTITEGKWHHIVFTCKNSDHRIYVDGERLTNISHASYVNNKNIDSVTLSNVTFIGNRAGYTGTGYPYFAEGDIGQIRIYSNVLTESQIRQNYNFTKNDYPNGFNGDITGASWNSSGHFTFDGNDEIDLPDVGDVSALGTLAFWFKTTSTSSTAMVPFAAGRTGNSDNYTWAPIYITAGKISYGYMAKNGGWLNGAARETTATYNDGNWHHAVVVYSGTYGINQTHTLYVDGTEITSTTDIGTQAASNVITDFSGKWSLGYYGAQDALYYTGDLAEVKVFNRKLTSGEVTTEYNKGQYGEG